MVEEQYSFSRVVSEQELIDSEFPGPHTLPCLNEDDPVSQKDHGEHGTRGEKILPPIIPSGYFAKVCAY